MMQPLVAGRELDALIGKKIFGYQKIAHYGPTNENNRHLEQEAFATHEEAMAAYKKFWPDPSTWPEETLSRWHDGWGTLIVENFSTDIAEAWMIVEKLNMALTLHSGYDEAHFWRCRFGLDSHEDERSAPTAPLAICLAALAAIGDGR